MALNTWTLLCLVLWQRKQMHTIYRMAMHVTTNTASTP